MGHGSHPRIETNSGRKLRTAGQVEPLLVPCFVFLRDKLSGFFVHDEEHFSLNRIILGRILGSICLVTRGF